MIKKALINFAMIQTFILASSISVGIQIPTSSGSLAAIGFVWIVAFLLSLFPAAIVSAAFAYFSK
jgi:hypothetical protein